MCAWHKGNLVFVMLKKNSLNLLNKTILLLGFTASAGLWAQNQDGLIRGKLADEKGKPVAFADVIITDSLGKVFAGTISDTVGAFRLHFNRAGHLLLKVRHIGYQNQQRRIDLQAGDSLKLGTLVLKPSERRLAAVKVSKHKPLIEQQIDRLVFHVDNSLVAKSGGDALDALRISPKVWVKAEMGQIEMIGKKGVSVLIDGRFSRLSGGDLIAFLQGIPASDIERIEVISNPPAQYEAANNSGLINIVMKHRSNYWNAHIIPSYSQSTYPTGGIKGIANYQKNRLSTTAFSNLTQGARAPEEESVYFYPTQRWAENHKSKNFTDSKSGRLTVEYRPSDKWTLGSQLVATSSHPENRSHIRTAIFGRGHAQSDSIIQTNRRALSDSKHIAVNVFSDFKLDTTGKKKLHLNLDLFDHDADSDSRFSSALLKPIQHKRQSQSAGLNITNYAAKADLVLPYKRLEWSFGGKISATKVKRSSQFHSIAVDPALLGRIKPNQTDAFEYRESIAAGYVSSRIHWDDKWGTQLGLRYEHTHTRGISKTMGRDTKNGYSDLFPTAYTSYVPNDHNAFSLSYGRRIGRPNFHHLNPFEHFSDPFSYTVGNPDLKPEFTHNIEFNHIYKNDLTTILYYSLTDDAYKRISRLKPHAVRASKPLNNFQHMKGLKFSRYHISTDALDAVGMPGKRIVFSTRTATSILIDENKYQSALHQRFDELEGPLFQVLKEKEFLVPADRDEYRYLRAENQRHNADTPYLSTTLQPTANCQLGCHYCGQTHTKHYADDAVIDKYVERISHLLKRNPNYQGLSVTWYGGEPLTGLRSIRKTSQKLIEWCRRSRYDYRSDMITNGLSLKPKVFESLVGECGITQYQITLDGTAESHDQRRMTKKGAPTFDIIVQNIVDVTRTETYSKHNCEISIRVNIDQTNHRYVTPLIQLVKEKKLQEKISMYFAAIVDFGSNDAGKDSLDADFFAEKEVEWLYCCYENGIRVRILPERVYSVCMVENKDSEVYDAFGNMYACWEFPYDKEYSQGESRIGNLFDSPTTYNPNASLRNWSAVVDSGKTWCKRCVHLPVCGGGCPKSWHEGKPACPPFKFNYKDKLLLDYYIRKTRAKKPLDVPGTMG
ncbi:MAG: TonB-dependent receptor [Flavobacteriales bacterium]